MRIIVLGAAAGGGFPQWNCGCPGCRRARAGEARPCTQSSLAVSADGERWVLLNASPDLRQQIQATPALHPRGLRHSPIGAVVLTNADVDHVAGLLDLREGHAFTLYASPDVLGVLAGNSLFGVLNPDLVSRRPLAPGAMADLAFPDGPAGLSLEMFSVPGKVALYLEGEAPVLDAEAGHTVGLDLRQGGRRLLYVPGCARLTDGLLNRLHGADVVFFDGTVWTDTEMRDAGVGGKTGRRMGHLPIGGPDGSLAGLAGLRAGRRIYIHINNTNPILLDDSRERAALAAAGWEVAADGLEITL